MKPCRTARVLLICVLALAGCSGDATPGPLLTMREPVAAPASPVERFVRYFAAVRGLSPEALHQERARQERVFTEQPSAENRLRLAVLLSVPGTDGEQRFSARELLQGHLQAQEPPATDLDDIAAFFVMLLQERQPVQPVEPPSKPRPTELHEKDKQLASQQQRIKKLQEELEAQRALYSSLHRQLQDALGEKGRHMALQQQLNKKLQDERRNVKRLQEKIEKIKDIEKSLMDRERTDNKGT